MSEGTANNSNTPELPEMCKITTYKKVTKEYILPNWASDHEQLIDFANVDIKLGFVSDDKDCAVRLCFGRYTPASMTWSTEYVSLFGFIQKMYNPFMLGLKLTIVSKSGREYLKDHFVCFRGDLDRKGKCIKRELFPHKRNESLVIKEKDIHLIITIEPSSFHNVIQSTPETLETKLEIPENPVSLEKSANISLQQQTSWGENVRKFLQSGFEKATYNIMQYIKSHV